MSDRFAQAYFDHSRNAWVVGVYEAGRVTSPLALTVHPDEESANRYACSHNAERTVHHGEGGEQ